MNAGLVGLYGSTQQGGQLMAVRGVFGRSPASVSGDSRSVNGMDSVDLWGLDSIDKAFQMLREQDIAPLPEGVSRAIRQLVQEVLNDLPGSA